MGSPIDSVKVNKLNKFLDTFELYWAELFSQITRIVCVFKGRHVKEPKLILEG